MLEKPPGDRDGENASMETIRPSCDCATHCDGMRGVGYALPPANHEARILMLVECLPADEQDYFFSGPEAYFWTTLKAAMAAAGHPLDTAAELAQMGIGITPAVRCAKAGNAVSREAVERCSHLLEQELLHYSNLKVILLMGDAAIKAINYIGRRTTRHALIPGQATYRIRGQEFNWRGVRLLPSYLPTGKSFLIEKSKQTMVAEDIRTALELAGR